MAPIALESRPTEAERAQNESATEAIESAPIESNGQHYDVVTELQQTEELGYFGTSSSVAIAGFAPGPEAEKAYQRFLVEEEAQRVPDLRSMNLNKETLRSAQDDLKERFEASPEFREALINRVENEHPLAALEKAQGDKAFTLHDIYLESSRSKLPSSKSPIMSSSLSPDTHSDIPLLQSPMTYINPELNSIFVEHGGFAMGHRWMGREDTLDMIKAHPGRAIAVVGCDPIEENIKLVEEYLAAGAAGILVDVNISWTDKYLGFIKDIRDKFDPEILIAGNVDHPAAVLDLFQAGATVVKIGVGPGSHCKTRKVTPIGRPQASNISACCHMARLLGMYTIADGGVQSGGRAATLAMGLGADYIMKGRIYASTDQGGLERKFFPGDWLIGKFGQFMKGFFSHERYQKMAELTGYRRHYHGMAEKKFQDRTMKGKKRPGQGYESWVRETGDLHQLLTAYVDEITVGTASLGASNIADLQSRTKPHAVTASYEVESGHRTYT